MLLAMGWGNGRGSAADGEDKLAHKRCLLGVLEGHLVCQLVVAPYELDEGIEGARISGGCLGTRKTGEDAKAAWHPREGCHVPGEAKRSRREQTERRKREDFQ